MKVHFISVVMGVNCDLWNNCVVGQMLKQMYDVMLCVDFRITQCESHWTAD